MSAKGKRFYWWSVTINNPTDESRLALSSPPEWVKEMWYQDEVGEQGTLHIQAAIYTNQIRFSSMKQWLPMAHIEAAKNKDALVRYCQKSETAVQGTYTHFLAQNARPANVIYNNDEEELVENFNFSLSEILMMIASHVHEDEWHECDAREQYEAAVNRLTVLCPHLVDKFTRQNVLASWRIVNFTYLRLLQQIQNESEEVEEVSQSVSQVCECRIECDCLRDNCEECNFWERYVPDIISIPVV